jgi:hypothetical protein
MANATIVQRQLQKGRPDRASDGLSRRDQRDRRATSALEPAADVGDERREHARRAEQAHQYAVAGVKLEDAAGSREHEARGHHRAAKYHHPAHAELARQPACDDAADSRADVDDGAGTGWAGARRAELGRDRLHGDHCDQRRAVAESEDDQRRRCGDPGRAAVEQGRIRRHIF